jgi:hypothetical protein
MRRHAGAMVVFLVACAPTEPRPDEVPPNVFEPIGTGTLYSGIQIGEGGDELPCTPALTLANDVTPPDGLPPASGFLDALDRQYRGLPFDIAGTSGTLDVEQFPEPEAYLLTYTPTSTIACSDPTWVAGVWVTLRGDGISVDLAATALGLEEGEWTWHGLVVGADIGLADSIVEYVVSATPDGDDLVGTIYEPGHALVGGFGR